MKIRLNRLELSNFQGIKSFTLEPNGDDLSIYGDNSTGKTTVANAFSWLLFDKDTTGQKDFAIKTLDKTGEPIHGLCHKVAADLDVGDQVISLSKSYKEKWVKKRGTTKKEFTGHTTDYEIDGVPVKKKEFDLKVSEIAAEDTFKLLTSPTYFNDQLHWSKRREVLIDCCGDVSDEDVIRNNDKLADLHEILSNRSIEDHQKVISSKKRKINDKLKEIPARIDEAEMGLPGKPSETKTALSKSLITIKKTISERQKEIEAVESHGGDSKLLKQKADLLADLANIRKSHYEEFDADIEKLREKKRAIESKADADLKITRQINYRKSVIEKLKKGNEATKARMDELREQYIEIAKTEWEGDLKCYVCGQGLPEEKIEKAKEKYNLDKSKDLEDINIEGIEFKGGLEEGEEEIDILMEEIIDLENKRQGIEPTETAIKSIQDELAKLHSDRYRYSDLPGCKKIVAEIEKIDDALASPTTAKQKTIEAIEESVSILEAKRMTLEDSLSAIRQRTAGDERIKELKTQERELAAEYENLERELFLAEEFIRTKVSMLEEKINGHFGLVKFRLFETQINEGIKEICEATVSGVPYGSGLNGGARINSGLDVINTLSKFYEFYPPIFVDNSESVTELLPTESQMIRLVVSEKDKKLRIEN